MSQQQPDATTARRYYQYYMQVSSTAQNPQMAQQAQAQADYYLKWVEYHKATGARQQQAEEQHKEALQKLSMEEKAQMAEISQQAQEEISSAYAEYQRLRDQLITEQRTMQERSAYSQQAAQQKASLDDFEQKLDQFTDRLTRQREETKHRLRKADEEEVVFGEMKANISALEQQLERVEQQRRKAESAAVAIAGAGAASHRVQAYSLAPGTMRLPELRKRYPALAASLPPALQSVDVHWDPSAASPGVTLTSQTEVVVGAKVEAPAEMLENPDAWLPVAPLVRERQLPEASRYNGAAYAVSFVLASSGSPIEHPWKVLRLWGCAHAVTSQLRGFYPQQRRTDVVPYGGFWSSVLDGGDPSALATMIKVAKRYARSQLQFELYGDIARLFSATYATERGPLHVTYLMPILPAEKVTLPVLCKPREGEPLQCVEIPAAKNPGWSKFVDAPSSGGGDENSLIDPLSVSCNPEDPNRGSFDMKLLATLFEDRVLRLRAAVLLRDTLRGLPEPDESGAIVAGKKRKREESEVPEPAKGKHFPALTRITTRKEQNAPEQYLAFNYFDEAMKQPRKEQVDYDNLLSALLSLDEEVTFREVGDLLARAGASPSSPLVPYRQFGLTQTETLIWRHPKARDVDLSIN